MGKKENLKVREVMSVLNANSFDGKKVQPLTGVLVSDLIDVYVEWLIDDNSKYLDHKTMEIANDLIARLVNMRLSLENMQQKVKCLQNEHFLKNEKNLTMAKLRFVEEMLVK